MSFNKHSHLEGRHATISASKHAWVNYDEDKFLRVFTAAEAAARGDRLHALAAGLIRDRVNVTRNSKSFNMYVNDAIGFRMSPEQPLYYTENAFGTADAIGFDKQYLRVFDLKTGVTPGHVRQLEVYAALFCLEYGYTPFDMGLEFRIYQSDEKKIFDGDPDVVFRIMEKIIQFDKLINRLKMEEAQW